MALDVSVFQKTLTSSGLGFKVETRDKLALRLRYKVEFTGENLATEIRRVSEHNPNLANAWGVRAVNKLAQDLEVLFWEGCAFYVMDLTKNTLEEILNQILGDTDLGDTDKSFGVRREMVKSMLTDAKWELNVPRWPPDHLTAS